MDWKRVVFAGSLLCGFATWLVLAQYLIDDVLGLAIALAVALAGPLLYQVYEVMGPGSGSRVSRL
ncbi:hypothetical protein [Halocalculus aciditolerans]|uniref:hypothetical protein n=1 Tax=Halocalculus aciditolerans TaxID=1383812 RepID=UPI00166CF07E|nr:hypothetical protein [Halocalculus aciditolerans]